MDSCSDTKSLRQKVAIGFKVFLFELEINSFSKGKESNET